MKTANDSNVHSVFHRLASLSQRVYQKHVIAVSSQLLNDTCEEYAASGSCFHQAIFITKSSVIHIILVTLHTTEAHRVGIMNECLVILRRSLASCDQNHGGRRFAVCVFRGSWRFYCFAQSISYIDVVVQPAVTPLLTLWSYHSLSLSHRYVACISPPDIYIDMPYDTVYHYITCCLCWCSCP